MQKLFLRDSPHRQYTAHAANGYNLKRKSKLKFKLSSQINKVKIVSSQGVHRIAFDLTLPEIYAPAFASRSNIINYF